MPPQGRAPRAAARRQAPTPEFEGGEIAKIAHEWWADSSPSPVAQELLVAAIELFAEQGYHATKTRDIAARIGMSTGAMYAHFRSKEELLFEISLTGHERGFAALAGPTEAGATPSDELAAMVRAFTTYHATFHTIAKIVHYELYGLTEEHLARVLEVRHRTSAWIEDAIRRGVAAKVFSVPGVSAVARALLSLCVDVARWYREDLGETPAQIGELNAELALRMVGAERA